jgi:hypothetical protein
MCPTIKGPLPCGTHAIVGLAIWWEMNYTLLLSSKGPEGASLDEHSPTFVAVLNPYRPHAYLRPD